MRSRPKPKIEAIGLNFRYFPISLESAYSVAISPDGYILASDGNNATVKVWNLQTGELLDTLSGHSKFGSVVDLLKG